jgi:hypothetical protein
MRPSVSYGYAPSFEKYYDTYASDWNNHKAIFKFGAESLCSGLTNSNTLGFDLSNTFEASKTALK